MGTEMLTPIFNNIFYVTLPDKLNLLVGATLAFRISQWSWTNLLHWTAFVLKVKEVFSVCALGQAVFQIYVKSMYLLLTLTYEKSWN